MHHAMWVKFTETRCQIPRGCTTLMGVPNSSAPGRPLGVFEDRGHRCTADSAHAACSAYHDHAAPWTATLS